MSTRVPKQIKYKGVYLDYPDELPGLRERIMDLIEQETGGNVARFARGVGVSDKRVHAMIQGESMLAAHALVRLARAYPDRIGWLLTGDRSPATDRAEARVRQLAADLDNLHEDLRRERTRGTEQSRQLEELLERVQALEDALGQGARKTGTR